MKTVYGDELNLGPWSRNGGNGTRGQLANGIATVDDYGKTQRVHGGPAHSDSKAQDLLPKPRRRLTSKSIVALIVSISIADDGFREGLNPIPSGGKVKLKTGDPAA